MGKISVENKLSIPLIKSDGIYIDGKPQIVLCSSLFYFRIPRDMWRDRLQKVKRSGYNCIDVYFPWNYHEQSQGQWDFTGDRDAAEYLNMAAEEGLWVIARPGPYICSEWDGGALPSYIFTKEGIKIRDYNPVYLKYVREWYSRIIPIISDFQYGSGGTVIAVQIENELDFYNCENVNKYMCSLRDMAVEYGIRVPIVACAGQSDIVSAGGTIPNVVPTFNFYPDIYDGEFENKLEYAYKELKKLGFPLCVTETNKMHFILRRLLCNGAKFIGPYNQVGGTDFGFTTSINNWGKPLSFLTHDYSFGGMITPHGQLTDEYYEGRLFSSFINTLGESLALAEPEYNHSFKIISDVKLGKNGASVLKLNGGGYILGISNVDDRSGNIEIYNEDNKIHKNPSIRIDKHRCLMLMFDFPIKKWDIEGKINYSTAELVRVEKFHNNTVMLFSTEYDAEISLKLGDILSINCENVNSFYNEGILTLSFKGNVRGKVAVTLKNRRSLIISICMRQEASKVIQLMGNGDIVFEDDSNINKEQINCENPEIQWNLCSINESADEIVSSRMELDSKVKYMEELCLYRGFAWYGARVSSPLNKFVKGYVIHNASDIVSLYADNRYSGTYIPGGNCIFVEEKNSIKGSFDIVLRTEIWGHCNFDDSSLPSLKINSFKGISGMTVVTNLRELNSNWRYFKGAESAYCLNSEKLEDSLRPLINFAFFHSTEQPQIGYYKKKIKVSQATDSWILYLKDFKFLAKVYVDGEFVKLVNNLNTYILLDEYLSIEGTHELTIYLEQKYTEESKDTSVILIEGIKPSKWWVKGAQEKDLWESSMECFKKNESAKFPLTLKPGCVSWITGSFEKIDKNYSYIIRCKGNNLKVAVFVNGHMLGRTWLNCNVEGLKLTGGDSEVLYLPCCWLGESNKIAILAEAVNPNVDSDITEVLFECIQ